jgi:anhydro-N-acetylmuramic acid kinase
MLRLLSPSPITPRFLENKRKLWHNKNQNVSSIRKNQMSDYYVGLMSGTSADGIDAALVDFTNTAPTIIATHYTPHTPQIREKIFALSQKGEDEIRRLAELDVILGHAFANATNHLLQQTNITAKKVKAIGSHGQTIRHYPHQQYGYSLQIGDANIIAAKTGITTVADFRRKDIALGGHGAPLVPAFHHAMFASNKTNRAIVNIGGIANITLLPKKSIEGIVGFDTGPGNALLDTWIETHRKQSHDERGEWGAQGVVQPDLLELLLADPYFTLTAPKSTGREYFNLYWLKSYLHKVNRTTNAIDVQATLVELTAQTIITAIQSYLPDGDILICGGGAHNLYLMLRLQALAGEQYALDTTEAYGIHPDWVEAVAFAWLAKQTMHRLPGNLPSVTGASKAAILGGIYYAG